MKSICSAVSKAINAGYDEYWKNNLSCKLQSAHYANHTVGAEGVATMDKMIMELPQLRAFVAERDLKDIA